MRIWHYKMLPYLPRMQLLSQKREIDLIWKDIANGKKTNHILINYIYEYIDYEQELYVYYKMLEKEFKQRKFKFRCSQYCSENFKFKRNYIPFEYHHNLRYLEQCYFNLEEKYDRKQKDFDPITFRKLRDFYLKEKQDFYKD